MSGKIIKIQFDIKQNSIINPNIIKVIEANTKVLIKSYRSCKKYEMNLSPLHILILTNNKKQIIIMGNTYSKGIQPKSQIKNNHHTTTKKITQSSSTNRNSLVQPNSSKQTSLSKNSKKEFSMGKPQQKYMNKNNFIEIESGGVVNIINDSLKSIEIAEMLEAEPIISSMAESGHLKKGGKPRELCKKPYQPPFSAIGVLFTMFNYQNEGYGTAFLIADNVALTAAHNVYSRQSKISAIYVNLIMEIHQKQGKSFRAVCAYVPKEYKQGKLQEEMFNNDFAILILGGSEELTKRKYSKIQLSSDVQVKDKVGVYGYPFEFSQEQKKQIFKIQRGETVQKPREKYLFGSQDEIVQLEKERIFYKATTSIGDSGSPVLRLNHNSLKYEAVGVHTHVHQMQKSGVRITNEVLIRINKWIQDFWKGKENDERMMLIDIGCYQIVPAKPIQRLINKRAISITPDTTTYAWKQNKQYYRQDNANKNVCIYQGLSHQWLCSSDLCDGECVFTIKVHKVQTYKRYPDNVQVSGIDVGLMDSNYKGKQWKDTLDHCVYLNLGLQKISRPNQQQTKRELIKCSCQSKLASVPCLIECHVNRQLNTIAWHYNGKEQAITSMPQLWKDDRNLCAVVSFYFRGGCVEFM